VPGSAGECHARWERRHGSRSPSPVRSPEPPTGAGPGGRRGADLGARLDGFPTRCQNDPTIRRSRGRRERDPGALSRPERPRSSVVLSFCAPARPRGTRRQRCPPRSDRCPAQHRPRGHAPQAAPHQRRDPPAAPATRLPCPRPRATPATTRRACDRAAPATARPAPPLPRPRVRRAARHRVIPTRDTAGRPPRGCGHRACGARSTRASRRSAVRSPARPRSPCP